MRWSRVGHETRQLIDRKATVEPGKDCEVHACPDALLITTHDFRIPLVQRRTIVCGQMSISFHWCTDWISVTHLKPFENVIAVFFLRQPDSPSLNVLLHLTTQEPLQFSTVTEIKILLELVDEFLVHMLVIACCQPVINVYREE
jgi:hypothetical protein